MGVLFNNQTNQVMKILLIILFTTFILPLSAEQLPERHGAIDTQLYVGEGINQPLVVGFGGGEGGNAWASDYWKKTRDEFLSKGYAFLAVGYFGLPNTSQQLDRISLNAIHKGILQAKEHPQVSIDKVALIGGSKGAELVLNLASRYTDINAVVAIVPSHVSFPALTYDMGHSSWMFDGQEVPYIAANERIIPAAIQRDLHTVFSILIEDQAVVEQARIQVEKINGAVLLISAQKDEMWPSTLMSEQLIKRFKQTDFEYPAEHIISDGDHASSLNYFPEIFTFLERHFKAL